MSLRISLGIVLLTVFASLGIAQTKGAEVSTPFFGNATCPITGKETKADLFVNKGKERVFVCCKACKEKVAKDLEAAYAKAYPADKVIDLKNEKCPILGGKSKTDVTLTFQGRKVHFCCAGCDKKFLDEPNKHLARLTSKVKLEDLANDFCPVNTDEKVVADSFLIYDGKIINLCCSSCAKDFAKDPKGRLEALRKADGERKKQSDQKKGDHDGHGRGAIDRS